MKLLVDIGNSRIKWAASLDGALTAGSDAPHDGDPAIAAAALLENVPVTPAEVAIANVAGVEFGAVVGRKIRERWGIDAQFAASQPATATVRNGYRDYAQLGVDRWLAILAAAERYQGAVCIVDAGTAVTVDLLADNGDHQGGYIVPGVGLMWQALTQDTGDLGRLTAGDSAGQAAALSPGRGTGEAIGHGALASICAVIERCTRALAEDNRECVVVVTGGDAGRIIPHLAVELEHRPQLVLEGLALWEPG